MKIFKLMVVALVAMLGFTACDNDPEHIYDDHSADLVGTWSCLTENYAEVIIISADGTAVSYGVEDGEYWENVKGTVTVKENNITMIFDDDDNFTGHFDIIPGQAFSLFEDSGERYVYNYCANDLSDEIVGMWVCNDSKADAQNDMLIQTFNKGGKTVVTGYLPEGEDAEYLLNQESDYKVVGDLVFLGISTNKGGDNNPFYIAGKLIYAPEATANGDIMTFRFYLPMGNDIVESSESWLRIRQSLDLTNKKYDYHNIYVSNVKGEDSDIEFFNTTINFSKLNASALDKFLNATVFSIMFPDANTIKYSFLEGQHTTLDAPIVVEGNKMTIKMSAKKAAYRDVVVYAFQDADNTQMHIYMPTSSFETFFANGQIQQLEENGLIDINNTEAVAEVRNNIETAIETINVSFIFKTAK